MKQELVTLISEGKLKPGTVLFHPARIHKDRNVTAKVVHGGVEPNGRTFTSPSAAAESLSGGPINGWTFWRIKPSGEPLASVPGKYRKELAA